MGLSTEEQNRLDELREEIEFEEHNGKPGTFNADLIPLYREMQELYRKQKEE